MAHRKGKTVPVARPRPGARRSTPTPKATKTVVLTIKLQEGEDLEPHSALRRVMADSRIGWQYLVYKGRHRVVVASGPHPGKPEPGTWVKPIDPDRWHPRLHALLLDSYVYRVRSGHREIKCKIKIHVDLYPHSKPSSEPEHVRLVTDTVEAFSRIHGGVSISVTRSE